MGTVGLNFGSPTSGAGFNVSSTVAEIISNLQNVETPWKNQLTSLESQDTVISSLGTLFSNLSTDLSQLTDFSRRSGTERGLKLRHQRARAHRGHLLSLGRHAYGRRQQSGTDLERLHGGDRQQLRYAVRLGHAAGGQRHGADHHPRFHRQHALRPGFGHQRLRRGHHRHCAHRRHRLAAEPRLRHFGRQRQHRRHRRIRSPPPPATRSAPRSPRAAAAPTSTALLSPVASSSEHAYGYRSPSPWAAAASNPSP